MSYFDNLPDVVGREEVCQHSGQTLEEWRAQRSPRELALRGQKNEEMFFAVVSKALKQGKLPKWILSLSKSNALEDALGVDGFFVIKNLESDRVVVPFQLKSRKADIPGYFQKHPTAFVDDVPIFIAWSNERGGSSEAFRDQFPVAKPEVIIRVMRTRLAGIRRRTRERFHRIRDHLVENGVYPDGKTPWDIENPTVHEPLLAPGGHLLVGLKGGRGHIWITTPHALPECNRFWRRLKQSLLRREQKKGGRHAHDRN